MLQVQDLMINKNNLNINCIDNIAIIPARGGSKGLPNKNIKLLNLEPMIAYTIKAALKSGCFKNVVVSTDSEEILEIAKSYGAETPFLRPKELALDNSTTADVISHCLDYYEKNGYKFQNFTILQPTSPLRSFSDICAAFDIFEKKNAKAVVSVCEADHLPLLSNTLPESMSLEYFISDKVLHKRRQDFPQYYRINGAIYIVNVEYFQITNSFYGKDSYAYVMPKQRSVDIDDIIDFEFAEFLLKKELV